MSGRSTSSSTTLGRCKGPAKQFGVFCNLRADRIFASSVLQFFLQLTGANDEAFQAEAPGLKR
eukprot:7772116-Alexandrium_andersonii.AAC.1